MQRCIVGNEYCITQRSLLPFPHDLHRNVRTQNVFEATAINTVNLKTAAKRKKSFKYLIHEGNKQIYFFKLHFKV